MTADIVDISLVKAQRQAAAHAAELSAMCAVKGLVDKIIADKASGSLLPPDAYLSILHQGKST